MLKNKNSGLSADKLRMEDLKAGVPSHHVQKLIKAGKPAATSLTIGSGPAPKGFK